MQVSSVGGGYGSAMAMFATQSRNGMQGPPPPPPLAGVEFSSVDSDSDGSITEAELASAIQADQAGDSSSEMQVDNSRLEDLFQKLDSDGDDKISPSEWTTFQDKVAGMAPPGGGAGGPPKTEESTGLSEIDTDGDGKISAAEWQAYHQKMEPQAGSSSAAGEETSKFQSLVSQLYKQMDADTNSQVSQNELSTWLSQTLGSSISSVA